MKKIFFFTTLVIASFFGMFSFQEINIASAAACTVNNATWSPSGEQKDDWYVAGKSKATITFNTTNCIGQTLDLDIKEADTCAVANCDDSLADSGLENKPIKIEEVTTKVDLIVGEEVCEAGPGFDCDYYFRIEKGDTLLYSSWKKAYGNLTYECDGTCLDNWKLGTITYSGGKGPIGSDGNPVTVDPSGNEVVDSDYRLLAPIGNLTEIGTSAENKIGDYLNIILMIAIGLCGALAVIMIVVRGVQYMGDESVFGKTEAKHHIMQAVLGLLLALGAYAILNTINPNLVGGSLTFNSVEIVLEGDVNAPVNVNRVNTKSLGIVCNGGGKSQIPAIARSFTGKMTYSQDIPKGQSGPNNTIKLDCSGFVNYVLSCADVDNKKINSGTSVIFSGAEKVTSITDTMVNGKALQVGDLVGWRPQDSKSGNGHVLIYIGNGQVADSHGGEGRKPGKALGIYSTTHYKDKIVFVKRM